MISLQISIYLFLIPDRNSYGIKKRGKERMGTELKNTVICKYFILDYLVSIP